MEAKQEVRQLQPRTAEVICYELQDQVGAVVLPICCCTGGCPLHGGEPKQAVPQAGCKPSLKPDIQRRSRICNNQ